LKIDAHAMHREKMLSEAITSRLNGLCSATLTDGVSTNLFAADEH
jgi:hypothetical protein